MCELVVGCLGVPAPALKPPDAAPGDPAPADPAPPAPSSKAWKVHFRDEHSPARRGESVLLACDPFNCRHIGQQPVAFVAQPRVLQLQSLKPGDERGLPLPQRRELPALVRQQKAEGDRRNPHYRHRSPERSSPCRPHVAPFPKRRRQIPSAPHVLYNRNKRFVSIQAADGLTGRLVSRTILGPIR